MVNQLIAPAGSNVPALVPKAGNRAAYRFLEFFTAQIRNPHTRRAYVWAVAAFCTGNMLAPRTAQDVRFNNLLLRANGSQSAWSFRWALNWSYTFWRPSAPAFPLAPVAGDMGVVAEGKTVKGGRDGTGPAPAVSATSLTATTAQPDGDTVTVDRAAKRITVVIQ